MLTHVEFVSTAFPPYDGESEQINPGRFGRRLGEYLASQLNERGIAVGAPVAEDWGWLLPIENEEFELWIGVGNYEEYSDGFLCFIEPHTEYVRKLWRKVRTRERVEAVQKQIDQALRAHPDVRDVKWWTYEDFHRSSA
jgi:hypothetical protein